VTERVREAVEVHRNKAGSREGEGVVGGAEVGRVGRREGERAGKGDAQRGRGGRQGTGGLRKW